MSVDKEEAMLARGAIPINKRWPGKWAVRVQVWRPDGSKQQTIETDMAEGTFAKFMEVVCAALAAPETNEETAQ